MIASLKGHYEVVELLLSANANPNALSVKKESPLLLVSKAGSSVSGDCRISILL